MPVFDAKRLATDPDLAVLSALLHVTPQAREQAIARGRERLAQGMAAFAAASQPRASAQPACLADAPAA